MNIEQMHIVFREYAQQMGMQTVRGILDEDIDICLNTSIINKTRSIIASNTATGVNDKLSLSNADISSLNGLRTLFRQEAIDVSSTGEVSELNPVTIDITNESVMLYTGFAITYPNVNKLYQCRIVETDYLGKTLRDNLLRASKYEPIVTVVIKNSNLIAHIYNGVNKFPAPAKLIYNYIHMPAKVSLANNISCDLPEYLHEEIVANAVNLWGASVTIHNRSSENNN